MSFDSEVFKIIESHEDRINRIQRRLYADQFDLIEAYKKQWAELKYLIKYGYWSDTAILKGTCYGLKLDENVYIFQLNMSLPFLPNTYYKTFEKSYKEFYSAKQMISMQLQDIVEQIGGSTMKDSAALIVKHFYRNVRMFDIDNKAKQVIINTLRPSLIADDNVNFLSYYGEESIPNDIRNDINNWTMIYLFPNKERLLFEKKLLPEYPYIDNKEGVIKGRVPEKVSSLCPLQMDTEGEGDTDKEQPGYPKKRESSGHPKYFM